MCHFTLLNGMPFANGKKGTNIVPILCRDLNNADKFRFGVGAFYRRYIKNTVCSSQVASLREQFIHLVREKMS